MKRFFVETLMFLPNLAVLAWRLLRDPRIPWQSKTALILGAIYIISPIDAIPDMIPFFGELDDFAIFLLLMDGILNHLDPAIVQRHWRGSPGALAGGGKLFRMLTLIIPSAAKDQVFPRTTPPHNKAAL